MTARLHSGSLRSICTNVSVSRLFAFFVAFSLLFGPLAMDRAMAAAPVSNHSQMTKEGHCDTADEGKADTDGTKSCCGAMCAAAVVVLPQAKTSEPLFERVAANSALVSFRRGVLSEISTPPPRLA